MQQLMIPIGIATFHGLICGNWSRMAVIIQLDIPTLLPMPNVRSIKKKITANTCGYDPNLAIASGYEIKANPAPSLTTWLISSTPVTSAK